MKIKITCCCGASIELEGSNYYEIGAQPDTKRDRVFYIEEMAEEFFERHQPCMRLQAGDIKGGVPFFGDLMLRTDPEADEEYWEDCVKNNPELLKESIDKMHEEANKKEKPHLSSVKKEPVKGEDF